RVGVSDGDVPDRVIGDQDCGRGKIRGFPCDVDSLNGGGLHRVVGDRDTGGLLSCNRLHPDSALSGVEHPVSGDLHVAPPVSADAVVQGGFHQAVLVGDPPVQAVAGGVAADQSAVGTGNGDGVGSHDTSPNGDVLTVGAVEMSDGCRPRHGDIDLDGL